MFLEMEKGSYSSDDPINRSEVLLRYTCSYMMLSPRTSQ